MKRRRDALRLPSPFSTSYNTKNNAEAKEDLKPLLSHDGIKEGHLLQHCLDMARARMREAGANNDRVKELCQIKADKLLKEVERFVARDGSMQSLWPIVKSVNVLLCSALLRNGVALIDLPGNFPTAEFIALISNISQASVTSITIGPLSRTTSAEKQTTKSSWGSPTEFSQMKGFTTS